MHQFPDSDASPQMRCLVRQSDGDCQGVGCHHPRTSGGTERGIHGASPERRFASARASSSVLDTLDAITSNRPYRRAQPPANARVEIVRCSGQQFDPRVVEAFLTIRDPEVEEIVRRVQSGLGDSWKRIG